MPFNIDLHTHTFFSGDGVSSPEDLIASARAKGLPLLITIRATRSIICLGKN